MVSRGGGGRVPGGVTARRDHGLVLILGDDSIDAPEVGADDPTRSLSPPLLPTGVIDFAYLRNQAGSDEGGRALFEKMVVQLVGIDFPQVQNLRALPGDWGIDGYIGELDDVVSVWQAKYFIDRFAKSQKGQITRSVRKLLTKANEEGFTVSAWTLCVPVDLEPDAMKWWSQFCRRMKSDHALVCELWPAAQLKRRLLRQSSEGVRRYFFPTVEDRPQLRQIGELPDSGFYDDSLFVAQLRAAHIGQIEAAKVEFYNAEILARDVSAKKDESELGELTAVRTTVRSLWAHRFDEACSHFDGDMLPGLHGQTMVAIENNYNSAPPSRLRSRVIHHFGMAHQLCDVGKVGWVRNYEQLAASHGS